MLLNFVIVTSSLAAAAILIEPRLFRWAKWRATITPLASIIGSGFLILGPVLEASYGKFAPLAMAGLCALAYLFGGAIRYNIALRTQLDERGNAERALEHAASWSLAFAYIISVAYYLNLFGAFLARTMGSAGGGPLAKELTSAVYVVILAIGWTRGFRMLERMEYASVTLKLAIIAGLLAGLAITFVSHSIDGGLFFNPPTDTGWKAVSLALGLLITVQGFETSRYLKEAYDAATRISSMKLAQWVSTAIYLSYILLASYIFPRGTVKLSETAVIDMMALVAPILPVMLVAAALSAQFSAAVADTSGSGGLLEELSAGRFSPRVGYAILTLAGLVLTWYADVFQIIAYASRAFALYYMLQSMIALAGAQRTGGSTARKALYVALVVVGAAIVAFGQAVEA